MHHPGARRHPLDVPRPQKSGVPCTVGMGCFSLQNVGDGLKTPVRVVGRANGLARCIVYRPQLIQHQKGIEIGDSPAGKGATYHKTAALPLLMSGDDLDDAAIHDFYAPFV